MSRARLEVLGLVLGGALLWRVLAPPPPPPEPALFAPGTRLDMPAPGARPKPQVESAMLVKPELLPRKPAPLGRRPREFDRPASEAAHLESRPVPGPEPGWWERWLESETPAELAGLVAVAFLLLWSLLTRALRRGPGRGGFTHD